MDLLKAEINRKRKVAEVLVAENSERSGFIGTSRFIRQSDVIKSREKELEDAQKSLDLEKEEKNNARKQEQEKNEQLKQIQKSKLDGQLLATAGQFDGLDVRQVKKRLRDLGQPITLFGEGAAERLSRFSAIMNDDRSHNEDDFRFNSATNNKGKQPRSQLKADEEDEEEFEEDDRAERALEQNKLPNGTSSNADIDSDDEDEKTNANAVGPATGYIVDGKRIQFSKIPNLSADKIVYKYFRSLLKEWEWDLNARDDSEKMTAKGKMETKTQKQCKDYIRPLFKLCKRKQVPSDISSKLLEMVQFCEDGNFRVAHDRYISTAIGNAAWPIGLTMVGIHERSGREKISTSKVAHVMNNELQRKYLTSVKRLMTFAQKKRPDVPPSMKVL
jgi:pre-mRNA-splicing factor 18